MRARASLWLAALLACGVAGLVRAQPAPAAVAEPPAAAPDPRAVVGAPRGPRLDGAALDERAEAVGGLLRCPVCQGLSVADSPSTMAVKMRAEVKEMLRAGYDQDQVLAYFEGSYGEFVRLQPPLRGVNWIVWLAPGLALLGGAAAVAVALRRIRARGAAEPAAAPSADVPGPDTLPDDPRLASAVLRVREMAYGWSGGRPPGPEA